MSKRGGARQGAGRPKSNPLEKQEQILNDLLIPAFKACNLGSNPIALAARDIKAAYGVAGLAEWKRWFAVTKEHRHVMCGSTATEWSLKLSRIIAATKLLEPHQNKELPFPSHNLLEQLNKKAYIKWCKEFLSESTKISKEFGTSIKAPPAYKPLTFEDKETKEICATRFKGWSEQLMAESHGFAEPSDIPSELADELAKLDSAGKIY